MNTENKKTAANTNHDNRFANVNHTCLLPGKSNVKCDHWGCKVTAKQPQYYPGWKTFFNDRGTTLFHIHKRKKEYFTAEEIDRMSKEMSIDKAWLTPMPHGEDNKPNLNTGWIVEAEGYWPERSIYNADEVAFINLEYETLRSKSASEIKAIISTHDVDKSNFYTLFNERVLDVKEVAIFIGATEVKGGANG